VRQKRKNEKMKYPTYDMDLYAGASAEVFNLAQILRRKMTPAEKVLWEKIRNNKLGVKFRRQHPIYFYIADFYCHELKLVIELDGGIHYIPENKERDEGRTAELERFEIIVKRFKNNEVLNSVSDVINKIKELIKKIKEEKQKDKN
jgi:very-short-patch-repair endonuclease